MADNYFEGRRLLREALSRNQEVFGLRNFPGKKFRVSPASSYYDGLVVVLYAEVLTPDGWVAFAKGTESELSREQCAPSE